MSGQHIINFMNKLIVSVGLAALGASTLHAQYSPTVTPAEMAKPWSVAASVRGFYDDNYLTLPSSAARSTYGMEFSPSGSLNYSVNNTAITASYVFDWRYYDASSTSDMSHQFKVNYKSELFRARRLAGRRGVRGCAESHGH